MARPILTPGDVHSEGCVAARMCVRGPARRSSVAQRRLPGAPSVLRGKALGRAGSGAERLP